MYPEFIAIYVMLGIVILMLGAVIFLLIKLFKKESGGYQPNYYAQPQYQQPVQPQYQQGYQNVVFCKSCATQFDASMAYCPNCRTPR